MDETPIQYIYKGFHRHGFLVGFPYRHSQTVGMGFSACAIHVTSKSCQPIGDLFHPTTLDNEVTYADTLHFPFFRIRDHSEEVQVVASVDALLDYSSCGIDVQNICNVCQFKLVRTMEDDFDQCRSPEQKLLP